jgi:hypothetical protein
VNPEHRYPALLALPQDLDDAAAAALLDFFYEAARVLENHYAAQLIRHYHRPDPRQQPLWDDDPPF